MPTTAPRPFFGWIVVGAAFIVATFGWGVGFYGPPVYLKAVQDARGWSVALVSTAVTVHFLIGTVVVANMPGLHRRFGLPMVTISGAVILGLGIVGWAVALEPWQLFVATLFSGAGWVALGAAAINAMIAPWFVAKRPAALSTAYNGASVGGIIFSPLWVFLIDWRGFPSAAAIVGVAMVSIVAVLAMTVLGRSPHGMGLRPDGHDGAIGTRAAPGAAPRPVANIWTDPAFVTLALGMALGLFAQIGLIAHLFSLLTPALGAQGAGLAAGLATAAAILGRTLAGWLMPSGADRRLMAALNYGVQACGCLAFVAAGGTSIPLLLLGVVLFGLGIGNTTSLPPLIAQTEFTREDSARAVALVVAVGQATYAFAPALFGLIRDATAGPDLAATPWVFLVALGVQIVAAGAYALGRKLFQKRRA